jgi:DNA-binding GntR family transcriptional regulator
MALIKLEIAPDLVDRVYQSLVTAISDGSLQPGERITQEDVAHMLDVSRQPVLQAFKLLLRDGLILDAPGRGVMVAPLDAKLIAHVYAVRAALDALATAAAAKHKRTAEERAELDEHFTTLITKGRKAAAGKSVAAMIDADVAFHQAVYEASGNPLIQQSAEKHWQHIRRAMGAVLQTNRMRDSVWDEHAAIAEAIVIGEARRAEQLARAHGESASSFMSQQIAQFTKSAR